MSVHIRPVTPPDAIAAAPGACFGTVRPAGRPAGEDAPLRARPGAGWWIVTLVIGGTAGWVAIIGALIA